MLVPVTTWLGGASGRQRGHTRRHLTPLEFAPRQERASGGMISLNTTWPLIDNSQVEGVQPEPRTQGAQDLSKAEAGTRAGREVSASQGTAGGRTIRVCRILAPTDFSPRATKALHWAVAMSTALRAELSVLHVVDLDALAYMDLGGNPALDGTSQLVSLGVLERVRADAERALSHLTKSFHAIHPMLREGSPREVIIQVAEELGADMIVMGTHGRSGLARVAFGSVADHIIRHSTVPVLTVREPESA